MERTESTYTGVIMILQRDEHKGDVVNAYHHMILQEANENHIKKIHKTTVDFIKKNKADFKDFNNAIKVANSILSKTDESDIISVIADLSNLMKDSKKHENSLDNIIDMV